MVDKIVRLDMKNEIQCTEKKGVPHLYGTKKRDSEIDRTSRHDEDALSGRPLTT